MKIQVLQYLNAEQRAEFYQKEKSQRVETWPFSGNLIKSAVIGIIHFSRKLVKKGSS